MPNYTLRIGFSGLNTYTLSAVAGAYSLVGQTTNLSYVPVGSNTITPSFTMTGNAGTAPYAVLFKAMATTSNVVQVNATANGTAYRQVEYSWDFGDATSGTWPISGLPRGSQVGGPISAHVFDSGTQVHTVTLTTKVGLPWGTSTSGTPRSYIVDDMVRQNGNTYRCASAHTPGVFATDLAASKWVLFQTGEISASTTQTVTVTSADTTYTGANTIYVSPSANYTNAPSGSIKQTTMPSLSVSNKRIMLRGGESYGDIQLIGTNSQVVWDKVGGTKPIVGRLTMGGTRSVISGVSASLGAQLFSNQTDCMYYNNDLAHSDPNSIVMYFDPAVSDAFTNMTRPWFVGNVCASGVNPIAGSYGAAMSPIFMGNTAGFYNQHSLRIFSGWEGFVAHNWWKGGSADGIRLAMKLHGKGFIEWPTTTAVNYATGWFVIANNKFGDPADNNDWELDVGPENDTASEGQEWVIAENNTFVNGTKTSTNLLMTGKQMTARGNTISGATLQISFDVPNVNIPGSWRGPYFRG